MRPENGMNHTTVGGESLPRISLLSDARQTLLRRRPLSRSIRVALVVGTVLVAINHIETITRGEFTPMWWTKVVLTYLVPFVVCNYGMLMAIRSARIGGGD